SRDEGGGPLGTGGPGESGASDVRARANRQHVRAPDAGHDGLEPDPLRRAESVRGGERAVGPRPARRDVDPLAAAEHAHDHLPARLAAKRRDVGPLASTDEQAVDAKDPATATACPVGPEGHRHAAAKTETPTGASRVFDRDRLEASKRRRPEDSGAAATGARQEVG